MRKIAAPPPFLPGISLNMRLSALIFVLLSHWITIPSLARPEEQKNSCVICHSDRWVEYRKSVHSAEKIGCVDCHGGNELDITMSAHSPRFGFHGDLSDKRGPFTRRQIVDLCAHCHSNPEVMKAYGLRCDQLDRYKTSAHGRAFFLRGDPYVPICTDCHGSHTVLSHRDPESPVYYLNVPQTCGRCHSDGNLMKHYGLPADIVERYREGVHGRALLQQHRHDVPNCTRCHGSHGASPPGVDNIEIVCGQCHVRTRQYFDESAHRQAFQKRDISQCTSCHAPHKTERATVADFEKKCSSCHEEGSGEFRRARQIQVMILSVQDELEDVRQLLDHARSRGIYVDDYLERLSEARTRLVEALPASHSLRLEDVERFTSLARGVAADIRIEVDAKLRERDFWRYLLLGIWIFLGVVLVGLYLQMRRKARQLESEQNGTGREQ